MSEPFGDAAGWVRTELARFPSPDTPASIDGLSKTAVKAYYDTLLDHHDRLSTRIAASLGVSDIAKERLKVLEAKAMMAALDNSKLSNATLRDAFVTADNNVVHAKLDLLKITGLKRALEALRKDTSKRMQRLDRELYERNAPASRQPPRPYYTPRQPTPQTPATAHPTPAKGAPRSMRAQARRVTLSDKGDEE